MLPWLSAEEIADLCEGLTQPAAQARFLAKLGIEAKRKPSGLFHALLQRMLQRLQDELPIPTNPLMI